MKFEIRKGIIVLLSIRVKGAAHIYTIVSFPLLRKGLQTFDGVDDALSQASEFDAEDLSGLRIIV